MEISQEQYPDEIVESAVGAIQAAALTLGTMADLPRVLAQVGEAIDEAGLSPSQLQVDVIDDDATRFEHVSIVADAPWRDSADDEAAKLEVYCHQSSRRWSAERLHGSYSLMAVPASHGVVTVAIPGQESIGTEVEELLRTHFRWAAIDRPACSRRAAS